MARMHELSQGHQARLLIIVVGEINGPGEPWHPGQRESQLAQQGPAGGPQQDKAAAWCEERQKANGQRPAAQQNEWPPAPQRALPAVRGIAHQRVRHCVEDLHRRGDGADLAQWDAQLIHIQTWEKKADHHLSRKHLGICTSLQVGYYLVYRTTHSYIIYTHRCV